MAADVSNLKINERTNIARPNLHESLKEEIQIEKIDLYQKENIRIGEIAGSAEYTMDEQFQNCQFS